MSRKTSRNKEIQSFKVVREVHVVDTEAIIEARVEHTIIEETDPTVRILIVKDQESNIEKMPRKEICKLKMCTIKSHLTESIVDSEEVVEVVEFVDNNTEVVVEISKVEHIGKRPNKSMKIYQPQTKKL